MPQTSPLQPESVDRYSSGLFAKVLTTLAIVYLMVTLFPGVNRVVFPGLDHSWQFALSYLSQSDYSFGKDVFFTYGPLGYLHFPLPVGSSLGQGLIFRLAAHLLLGALLFLHWQSSESRRGILTFIACFLILNLLTHRTSTSLLELYPDYYLLMIFGLILSLGLKQEKFLTASLTMCSAFSGLMLFAKFNTGIAAASFLFTALIALFIQQSNRRKAILLAAAVYAITVLVSMSVFIGGPSQVAMWLKVSLEMAAEFSVAMSILGTRFALVECLIVFVVFLSLTAWLALKKRAAGLVGLAFLPVTFLTFKSGFVRQDGHELNYFFGTGLILCAMIISLENWREIITAVLAFALAFAITAEARIRWWGRDTLGSQALSILSLKSGFDKIRQLINFRELEKQLAQASRDNLQALKLPEDWLDGIDRQRQSFDVLPWEINLCPANDLKWNPMPTLQTYTSYTSWLDDLNSAHFNNPNSPDFVLVGYETIDNRHLLWDTPSTWRMAMNNYQVEKIRHLNYLLMLKRKPLLSAPEWQTVGETVIAPNQWTEVPESAGLVYAQMNLSWNLSGRMRKSAFRLPPVMIELERVSGKAGSFRIMPDVARNGLLMNFPPNDFDSLARLFECQAQNPVRRFRITGRGADFLNRTIKLTWKKAINPCGTITQPTN